MSAAEMREALKPCPFCGAPAGKPRKITADERSGYQETVTISCGKGCGAIVGVNGSLNKAGWSDAAAGATEAAAIAAWNRRAPLPDEEGMVAAQEAAWGDPDVQAIYELLCDDMNPPEGEHWEGWVATRIATRLRAINGGEP